LLGHRRLLIIQLNFFKGHMQLYFAHILHKFYDLKIENIKK